jgi:hypothetical protein
MKERVQLGHFVSRQFRREAQRENVAPSDEVDKPIPVADLSQVDRARVNDLLASHGRSSRPARHERDGLIRAFERASEELDHPVCHGVPEVGGHPFGLRQPLERSTQEDEARGWAVGVEVEIREAEGGLELGAVGLDGSPPGILGLRHLFVALMVVPEPAPRLAVLGLLPGKLL